MAYEEILKELNEILESEKWSKFQLSEYNVKKFKSTDDLIEKIKSANLKEEAINISLENLKKNELNLIARYIIAILSFPTNLTDFYDNFEKIIENFKVRGKWSIVEYLCRKMIEIEKNEYALNNLILALKNLNRTSEILDVQKQLLELNPENTEISLELASFYEQNKDIKSALNYYKMALKVFINNKNKKMVEDIWLKIVDIIKIEDIDSILELETGLKLNFEPDFVALLLSFLLPVVLNSNNYDLAITILKKMLNYSPKNREYRDKIIEIYSIKYKDHSKLNDLLKSSGLKMWWKDVHKAIEIFEKQVRFDVNVYVYHHSWGTGKIIEISGDQLKIDFKENPEHIMTFDMALDTLEILPPHHIKVLKRFQSDEIKKLANENPVKLIQLIVESYPDLEVGIDELKNELITGIIQSDEWVRWWNYAKKELKLSPNFKLIENEKKIKFIKSEESYGEIIKNDFDKSEDFFEKIKIAYELIENDIHRKVDINIYQYITNWFIETLKNNLKSNPAISYISLIVINKLCHANKEISRVDLNIDESKIINSVSSIPQFLKQINILEYQKILINDIIKYHENWKNLLYEIMFLENSKLFDYVYEVFVAKKEDEIILEIIQKATDNYRDYPELFFWIAKNIFTNGFKNLTEEKLEEYKFKIMESIFFLLAFLGRQIKENINPEINQKIQKNIIRLLFDPETNIFINFIKDALNKGKDISTIIQLFKENQYIPKKHRENVIAELRSLETPVII